MLAFFRRCCQIEGAYLEDGKGLNNWDVFTHTHCESSEPFLHPNLLVLLLFLVQNDMSMAITTFKRTENQSFRPCSCSVTGKCP